ncbi:MAG TPA: flagellar biosynthetic protein FliO [Chthonomonadaceae bacterium]|nr:flagellar biosynthetic protein FliO [Chthonomonadaceae bacterium]
MRAICLLALLLLWPALTGAQGNANASTDTSEAAKTLLASPLEAHGSAPVHPADKTTRSQSSPQHKTAATGAKEPDWKAAWRAKWIREYQAKRAGVAVPKKEEPAARSTAKRTEKAAKPKRSAMQVEKPKKPDVVEAKPPVAAVAKPHTVRHSRREAAKAAPPPKPAQPAAAVSLASVTKPDAFGTPAPAPNRASPIPTQSSPLAAAGDAWKLLVYLVPMLLLILGALRLLRGFYERNGRLPNALQVASFHAGGSRLTPRASGGGLMRGLIGSFHLNNARRHGGSSIRLVESVPVGGANLHLIEVRGRLLLIGATSAGVSLLTEFRDEGTLEGNDFRMLLQAAASDMDALDLETPDLPAAEMVGTLEDAMRGTSLALVRNARRLHTVQEEEETCE